MRYPVGGMAFVPLLLLALGGVAGAAEPVGSDLVVNGLAMDGEEERERGFAPLVESGQRKWVVRFSGPIREEEKERVQKLGCVLHDYLPDFAFVATMDDAAQKEVAKLTFVSQVLRFRAIHKLPAKLREKPAKKGIRGAGETVTVHLKLDGPDSLHRVLSAVQREHGEVRDVGRDSLRVAVDEALLPLLAAQEEVVWINEYLPMELHNDTSNWVVQSNTPGAAAIWDRGIRGQGQVIAIGDTGLDYDMPWFRDPAGRAIGLQHRKIIGYDATYGDDYDADSPGHGTHVAGTAGGDRGPVDGGSGSNGLAPGSRLFVQDLTPGSSSYVNAPDDLGLMFRTALDAGARLHSNSWGNGDASYSPFAASADRFLWEHKEFVALFAVGNAGPGEATAGNPATAKNVISVGASHNGSSAGDLASFSSNGPTSDGRIKPTVTAPGYAIVSADSDGLKGSLNNGTTQMSGTSMATPAAAGAAALVSQYFAQGYYPSGAANPAHAMIPTAALVRAVLINSAQEMGGAFTDGPIPATGQGWGRINLANTLVFPGDSRRLEVFDESAGLATGEGRSRPIFTDGSQPLKLTLVWTDYPGAPGAARALVNDLDLAVTAPNGTIFLGNSFVGGVSVAGGNPDRLNVEEQVLLRSPLPGQYTVTVSGYNIPFGPQPFALVVTGGTSATPKGTITLDKGYYSSRGTPELTLVDIDLNRDPAVAETVALPVASTTEPGGEMALLRESRADSGVFTGTLSLAPGGAAADGLLQAANGDTITATYLDADDGSGQGAVATAAAMVDDVAPLLSAPEVTGISDTSATVSWRSTEAADTLLEYGTTPEKGGSVADGRLALTHVVNLSGLREAATYYAAANGTDEAGNRATGPEFTFTTGSLPPSLTVGSSEGSQTARSATVISGVSTDPSGVILVTINGAVAGYRPSDGYYSLTMPLQTGLNTFAVTAVDALGNSATASIMVARSAPPDLVMVTVAGPPSAGLGSVISIETSVCNSGEGQAGGFSVGLYLSRDTTHSGDDILLGSRHVATLAVGSCSSEATPVTIPVSAPGQYYYLLARADYTDLQPESDEGNNNLAGNQLSIVLPDLVMTGVSGPGAIRAGESLPVASSVQASPAGGSTGGFHVHLYLSADSSCTIGDTLLGSRYVAELPSGATSSATTPVTVPPGLAPGSYSFCAIADRYDQVKEENEGNNGLTGGGTTCMGADLVMSGVSGPGTIRAGESVPITNSVRASPAGGSAGGFHVYLYLSADSSCTIGDTLLGSRYVAELPFGATSSAITPVTVPPGLAPGSYFFCAIADRFDQVKEENEGNNGLTGGSTTCVGADLVMAGVSGPETIKGGESVQVTNSVQASSSGGAAAGFHVYLYLSADSSCTIGDTFLGSRYVAELPSGATSSATTPVTVPPGLAPGSYSFCAIADRFNQVKEGDEGNNGLTGNRATCVGADLVMTGVSGPGSIRAGETAQVTNSVQASSSDGAAAGFHVYLYLSVDSSCTIGDTLLGSRYVSGLPSGATSSAATPVTVPPGLAPGSYSFCAIADRFNQVKEGDEGNNALTGNSTTCTGTAAASR